MQCLGEEGKLAYQKLLKQRAEQKDSDSEDN